MKLRTLAKTVVPPPVRRFLRTVQQNCAFAALRKVACDTRNLRADVPPLQPIEDEWPAVQARIDSIRIGSGAGAVNLGDLRALYYLARTSQATSILEVGTHLGASTSVLALALKQQALPKLITVDILDVNGPQGAYATFQSVKPSSLMRELDCPFVEFVVSPSLPFMRATGERFDLIFLDGGHEAATVYQEVPLALRLLNPNGFIVLHDFFPGARPLWSDGAVVKGPWRALQRIEEEGNAVRVTPLGALPWPTKLGSNVTSLAVVSRGVARSS